MTEQEKREKVIKGLKYLHDVRRWSPDESEESITARRNITGDALALLKAQEPRVMTLGEVVNASGTPAWFDGRSKRAYTGWVLVYDVQEGMGITGTRVGVTKPGHITIWPATELYGAKWRCWTSSPTEAQREAVPWMT